MLRVLTLLCGMVRAGRMWKFGERNDLKTRKSLLQQPPNNGKRLITLEDTVPELAHRLAIESIETHRAGYWRNRLQSKRTYYFVFLHLIYLATLLCGQIQLFNEAAPLFHIRLNELTEFGGGIPDRIHAQRHKAILHGREFQ